MLKSCLIVLLVSGLFFGQCLSAFSLDTETAVTSTKHYPVFFVTDRQVKRTSHGVDFTNNRASNLTYGISPQGEAATSHKNRYEKDLLNSRQEFLSRLKETGCKRVAVFVHGYRKSFDGSLQTADEIASQIGEPVVMFAWPSKNRYSAYMTDECTAEWSSNHLADTLKMVGDEFGNGNVTIISHSLAARMVCWSFGELAENDALKEQFSSVLFFSPDIDRDVFLSDAGLIKRACASVKIYVDSHDSRLWLSKLLHGSPRLGGEGDVPSQSQLFHLADFDTTMQCHRLTASLITAAFGHGANAGSSAVTH